MRISDWSSDVCSSDLGRGVATGCFVFGLSAKYSSIPKPTLTAIAIHSPPGIASSSPRTTMTIAPPVDPPFLLLAIAPAPKRLSCARLDPTAVYFFATVKREAYPIWYTPPWHFPLADPACARTGVDG